MSGGVLVGALPGDKQVTEPRGEVFPGQISCRLPPVSLLMHLIMEPTHTPAVYFAQVAVLIPTTSAKHILNGHRLVLGKKFKLNLMRQLYELRNIWVFFP